MRRRSEIEQTHQVPKAQPQLDNSRETQRDASELTVISAGARLEGNLISAASLRIEGAVKGHITAEGDVILAQQAEISADIRAKNVTIAGTYSGNITASGTLELASTARVDGNISCEALIVNHGAVFSGQSSMGGPQIEQIELPKDKNASVALAEEAED
ncbi:MAG: polymer-forming cytoskeletal protein [Actinomycetota bacterium]|nr:polymer-forming cytoskeletal protein [Actinomycetota bacterium]